MLNLKQVPTSLTRPVMKMTVTSPPPGQVYSLAPFLVPQNRVPHAYSSPQLPVGGSAVCQALGSVSVLAHLVVKSVKP